MPLTYRQNTGKIGEIVAAKYLLHKGYTIVTRNYRFSRFGEIDLIVKKGGEFVFVEVKTRTNANYGRPQEAVHKQKTQKLMAAARNFLQSRFQFLTMSWRIDIVEVYLKNGQAFINHIENIH